MFNEQPWPLKTKKSILKVARKKFYSKDIAVSTARVLKLFEDNKNKCFTNQDIAATLDMSVGTVSGVTMRLEGLAYIRIVGNRRIKGAANGAQEFQHKQGLMPGFQRKTVEKGTNVLVEDTAQAVKEFFEKDKNAVYTKEEVIEGLKGYSKTQIVKSLNILVLSKNIKLLKDYEGNKAQYQHIQGNKEGVEVCFEPDENYTSIGAYVKNCNFVVDTKKLKENLPKHFRMFHSIKGYVPQYLKSDLDKCLKKSEKKGFFGKVLG